MDADEMQIDPAIAEAMGFSGFGMQTKKRKHEADDAFIADQSQPSVSSTTNKHQGTVANATPQVKQATTSDRQSQQRAATNADGTPTLEALRQGVPNAQGDMVYFLPSFIEDPWKDLEPR